MRPRPTRRPGFHYAFDCGNGALRRARRRRASTSCPTNDNGSRTVKGKVIDKDGGSTEYTTTVTVNNVAPTATLSNNGPVNEGSPATVTFSSQFDPSSADTTAGFHYAYDCDGGSLAAATYAGSGTDALDDLHVRRQRHVHGHGADHRQGRRLHRLHDHRHGERTWIRR